MMLRSFESIQRRELQTVEPVDITAHNATDLVGRHHMDELLAEADSGQAQLKSLLRHVAATETINPPSFDWEAYAGADFDVTAAASELTILPHIVR